MLSSTIRIDAFSAVTPRHVSLALTADDPLAEDWPYLLVQRQEHGAWVTAFTDTDPYTTFRCVRAGTGYEATVGWLLKSDLLRTGTYRLVYQGLAKRADGKFERFSAASSPFRVNVPGDDGTTPTPTPVPTATPAPVPTATPAPVNPFRDVPDDAYFRDAVLWAVSHEPPITQGVSADRFAPDETCTRAHFVTFLWRAAGEPEPAGKTCPFTDVQPGSYYEKAVRWAAERGVTVGVSETSFAPDDTVTRGQVVTFLWRFEGRPAPQNDAVSFRDGDPMVAPSKLGATFGLLDAPGSAGWGGRSADVFLRTAVLGGLHAFSVELRQDATDPAFFGTLALSHPSGSNPPPEGRPLVLLVYQKGDPMPIVDENLAIEEADGRLRPAAPDETVRIAIPAAPRFPLEACVYDDTRTVLYFRRTFFRNEAKRDPSWRPPVLTPDERLEIEPL